jgi:hypothetical protein
MTITYTKIAICKYICRYTKRLWNSPSEGLPKYTEVGISGMKIYHLATLHTTRPRHQAFKKLLIKYGRFS